jgi:formylglycine-generating enzyme required for sulfatase activity
MGPMRRLFVRPPLPRVTLQRPRQPAAALALLALATACQEAPVRAQLLVYVDLDMPVTSQASDKISPDAAMDSLRIEVLSSHGDLLEARVFSIANADVLPVAFGVRADAVTDGRVGIRVRAFRAAFAKNGEITNAGATNTGGANEGGASSEPVLDPRGEVSIDRLALFELPMEGVVEKSILLSGDCMGIPVRFGIGGEGDTTCIAGDRLAADAREGATDGALTSSVSGTWPLAAVDTCHGDLPAGARCIPGGFSILGDPRFVAHNELERDAVPLRPVVVSSFFMDATEVTVGELRAMAADGYDGPLPVAQNVLDDIERFCTWADISDPDLPVNCVSFALADAVCAWRDGVVPNEAQWEYAARGRGERNLFVWGDSTPECCNTSVGYFGPAGCTPQGPEPVGSHPITEACAGDVSRDGVFDLNGSVSELTRDAIAKYSDACWASPVASAILHDQVCLGAGGRIGRGGNWFDTVGAASLPIRRGFLELYPGHGFRCVY